MQIEVKDVEYTYMQGTPMEKTAVSDISFSINQGEFVCIIGHTGSGKSTLIQHINGLLIPTKGDVLVDGINTKEKKTVLEVRKKVGLVFQYPEYQLFEETVAKDIAFGCKNLGYDETRQQECVEKAMDMVGLSYKKYKDVSPFDLSGGQKRRVAIGGVVAMEPQAVILDEPTSGLDPKSAREILTMIKNMNESGITIIMVTHDMDVVYKYADRAIVINDGRLLFDDTPKTVFSHADELLEIGLDVPSGCHFAHELRKRGMDIPMEVMDVKDLIEAVRQVKAHE